MASNPFNTFRDANGVVRVVETPKPKLIKRRNGQAIEPEVKEAIQAPVAPVPTAPANPFASVATNGNANGMKIEIDETNRTFSLINVPLVEFGTLSKSEDSFKLASTDGIKRLGMFYGYPVQVVFTAFIKRQDVDPNYVPTSKRK